MKWFSASHAITKSHLWRQIFVCRKQPVV